MFFIENQDSDPEISFDSPENEESNNEINQLRGLRGGIQLVINSYIYVHDRAVKDKHTKEVLRR